MTDRKELIIAALVLSAIVIGILLTYVVTPSYGARVSEDTDGGLEYKISTSSATEYTVTAFDNARSVNKLYIYYDENYAVCDTVHEWQRTIISEMTVELRIRGFVNTEFVDADRLKEVVDAGYVPGDAIFVASGALPSTVYTGHAGDGMFKWVSDGGSLYWMGYAIGAVFADGKEIIDVAGYQEEIFGISDCILMDKETRSAERSANPLSGSLALNYDHMAYGLSVTALSGVSSLGTEYEYDGGTYGSITLIGRGDGMICVVGLLTHPAKTTMAQIISSGVSESSEMITGSVHGKLIRNSVTGTIDHSVLTGRTNVAVNIRMGEPNIVYARTFFF